jgi:pyruvate dehydrogenase complex dehydrogenase (E1) component
MNQNTDKIRSDSDPLETQEWLESLQAVIESEGPERAHYLIEQLVDYSLQGHNRVYQHDSGATGCASSG